MFDFSSYLAKSKCYDGSNKLIIWKMKGETSDVSIEELLWWKPEMYSFLVDDNSEPKQAKCVNRNVDTTVSHNEYKDVLLNNKYLRLSMNRNRAKDQRIKTYEINKISLSCFDDKIYTQNNELNMTN